MIVLVDDEDRENEGDLVMAAEKATPDAVNFMARYGRGLICLTLTEDRVRALEIPMMVDENRSARTTAFTVSIEARDGVTTGISAADRAQTIKVAIDPASKPSDLVSPGHIFPLRARPGGVLQRAGHTEGAVELARLAGLDASGVICEIMNDDGTMARYPDLVRFSEQHKLVVASIADLIQYRLGKERLVSRIRSSRVRVDTGSEWAVHVYEDTQSPSEGPQFMALVYGDITEKPTLVRVQSGNVLADVFGVGGGPRIRALDAVKMIEAAGSGVVLFLQGPRNFVADLGMATGEMREPVRSGDTLREFGLGAQVLADLGLRQIRIISNRPRRIAGLEAFGLELVDVVPGGNGPEGES